MAAKKGSTVTKVTETTLRLEILSPHSHEWGIVNESVHGEQDSLDFVAEIAARLKGGPIKYRLIERTVTRRVQTSETIIEGEGKA